ncbi:hypothetical protein V2J09_003573 [Rumex salicifolius]
MVTAFQSDVRSALHIATAFLGLYHNPLLPRTRTVTFCYRQPPPPLRWKPALSFRTFSVAESGGGVREAVVQHVTNKPSVCTADELHYVTVPNSEWRLALWRYHPNPQAPPRNHPLLLLSGVGTNAIGYDLAPESSFARHMSGQGYDTWILEVRGAGLSVHAKDKEAEQTAQAIIDQIEDSSETAEEGVSPSEQLNNVDTVAEQTVQAIVDQIEDSSETVEEGMSSSQQLNNVDTIAASKSEAIVAKEDATTIATIWDESVLVTELTETFMQLSERLSGFLSEGQSRIVSAKLFDQISRLLEDSQLIGRFNEIRERLSSLLEEKQSSSITGQIRDLSERLVNVIDEGQRSVSPQLFNLQERFSATIEDFQKQLDLIVKYDWDFDTMLDEDIPAVMDYIRAQCRPKDNRIFAVGHSMGGILLYALLSKHGHEGTDPMLSGVVTLASSVDYTTSKSSLKLLIPLADPAQVLQVPVVPLGALLTAAYPLSSRSRSLFSWLNNMISAEDMMHPELLEKLILNNFCTIPAKLLIQLTTAFQKGGLCNRDGTFFFKDHLHKSTVPVLALAGDRDLICPPEAVYETVKLIPEKLVTYKVLGESGGPHYAHYDLVGGRLAVEQVYPCIVEFLSAYD